MENLNFESSKVEFPIDAEEMESVAIDCGLKFKIPQEGSNAFFRLFDACQQYTKCTVRDLGSSSALNSLNEMEDPFEHSYYKEKRKKLIRNDVSKMSLAWQERRTAHNKLCVMILGTDFESTSLKDRNRISDFAVCIGGRDDLKGTFSD